MFESISSRDFFVSGGKANWQVLLRGFEDFLSATKQQIEGITLTSPNIDNTNLKGLRLLQKLLGIP